MAKSLVRPTSKGQVTIPKLIRQKLNLDSDTYLSVALEGRKVVLRPVAIKTDDTVRTYTDKQVAGFLKEDELSREEAAFLNRILKTNKY